VLGAAAWVESHSLVLAAMVALIGSAGLPRLLLDRLRRRRIAKFIANFPNAIDIIVRGVKSGLPLGDTIRIAASESVEPVRSEFVKIVESVSLGLTLPEAVERMAQRIPIAETNFFSIVISIQGQAGGNLSEAIGNLSRVLRERKKMKGKIAAMAMEAKASAAIIGAVPFLVVGALYVSSPSYVSLLWITAHGRMIAGIAIGWMAIGVVMMKKMIAFDI
jgi:tight adherence protein B